MRRILIRVLLLAMLPLGLAATPAEAKPEIPWGCTLLRNTMCHCLSPTGASSCIIID